MKHDSSRAIAAERLLALAHGVRLHCPSQASGRCLAASLQLARAAHEDLGLALELVKWRVVGDSNYGDHWAVALDEASVLDPTHVQVDGDARIVWPVASYPAAFRSMRRYPASLWLDEMARRDGMHGPVEEGMAVDGESFSRSFLWFCGTRVLRHDVAQALRGPSPARLASAFAEFGVFAWRFHARALQRALEGRARTLHARLAASERRPPP